MSEEGLNCYFALKESIFEIHYQHLYYILKYINACKIYDIKKVTTLPKYCENDNPHLAFLKNKLFLKKKKRKRKKKKVPNIKYGKYVIFQVKILRLVICSCRGQSDPKQKDC